MEAKQPVRINFKKAKETFREFVRDKARQAGSTIVYMANGQLIEEDPRTEKITILKEVFPAK